MSAPVRQPDIPPADPLASFTERCNVKALAWQAGEISLHDAVDSLQQTAEAFGLIITLGQDEVQRIMVDAFAPLRSDLPREDYDGTFAAACAAAHAEQASKPSDSRIEKLRRLLADEVSLERAWHELGAKAPGHVP